MKRRDEMIIHFDCKNCDEPVQDHCASCYACFDGDSGHGLDCDGESISFLWRINND